MLAVFIAWDDPLQFRLTIGPWSGLTASKRIMTHWSLALQPYQYSVVHRPGKKNANADALSHVP